jgi:hypothetical protein
MMTMMERSEAINRAQRALKALCEHPRSSEKELGHAPRAPQLLLLPQRQRSGVGLSDQCRSGS